MKIENITIDKRWKYVAEDSDGEQCFYECKPSKDLRFFQKEHGDIRRWLPIKFNLGSDWKKSLHEIVHRDDYIELIQVIERPDLQVDDLIFVSDSYPVKKDSGHIRRFAKWSNRSDRVLTFVGGNDSYTSCGQTTTWQYYEIPTKEELDDIRSRNLSII